MIFSGKEDKVQSQELTKVEKLLHNDKIQPQELTLEL